MRFQSVIGYFPRELNDLPSLPESGVSVAQFIHDTSTGHVCISDEPNVAGEDICRGLCHDSEREQVITTNEAYSGVQNKVILYRKYVLFLF